MKIAACFSGTLRQFKTCYKTFKEHIVDANSCDVDIFVSTWKSKVRHFKKQVPDEGSFKEMLELYNPVSVARETYGQAKRIGLYKESKMDKFQKAAQKFWKCSAQHRKDKCRFCGTNNIHNQIGQLYNIWNVNELKKEHEETYKFKYDLVIRNRFDNYFLDSLTDSVVEGVCNGSIWVPYGFDDFPEYGGGINDQFAIGTSESMDIYSNMYPNMYKYAMSHMKSKEGYGVPHRTILDVAQENNVSIERLWLKYTLYKKLDLYEKRTKNISDEDYKELRI